MSERPLRVVLVDDAVDVRALVRARLGIAGGFDVVGEAGTGREGIERVADLQPDVVLLDISMPDMDGFEAIRPMRAASPSSVVVVLTGFAEDGLAERAVALGAAGFLKKSVPIADLAANLRAVVTGGAIDERPRDELVLADHVERFRAAFEQAAIGMATLTLTGRIVRSNGALRGLAGVSSDDVVGTRYAALVDEAHRDEIAGAVALLATGVEEIATVEHALPDTGRRARSTLTVVRDSDRQPLYLFLQVLDVTELRESDERFRLLVESVGDYAIFLLDVDGNVTSWNRGAERIKGYRSEEIVGRHFSVFYTDEAQASGHPASELAAAARDGRNEEEGWRVRKDGSLFWANVVITAVRDPAGELRGFAKITRDTTERRAMVEALERQATELRSANELLGRVAQERTQFLAVTAHELRTPVTVVNGFASTLRDHWERLSDKDRVEMIAALSRGGERLARLVEELLTASRLEAGVLEVHATDFDLAQVVGEVVTDVGGAAGVTITADVDTCMVHADRGRVQQMITNYVTNALRYGRPPIAITMASVTGAAELRVSDAGDGVAPELLPRLFGKFARGSTEQGTGLGLFIVRELARAQGGDAWYEARAGGGSCFALRLPVPRTASA